MRSAVMHEFTNPALDTRDASILAVDDDERILRAVRKTLMTGFGEILSTTDPVEAISILQRRKVSVVICDQIMPGMKGIDLLALIRKRWPRIVTILLTGCSDMRVVEQALNQKLIDYFVTKPWETERLQGVVSEAMAGYGERRNGGEESRKYAVGSDDVRRHASGAVFALSRAVDARDRYTRKHSENVAAYAVATARLMGFKDDICELVRVGGLLHDLGKIGIPDGILLKKGRLEDSEFERIRMHPSIGLAIIEPIGFPEEVNAIVGQHHENHDGSGYPNGTSATEINLFARIVHVADAYDAMSTNRVYRGACSEDYIIDEFEKHKGTQFDPDVTDKFLAGLRSGAIRPGEVTV